ncbi:hypothetical protein LZ30DRAFT_778378 [Colletotrichum cereale]|nr:hypothetical protein LZ30DRAFT_778378 [Colletotrichum cereale]
MTRPPQLESPESSPRPGECQTPYKASPSGPPPTPGAASQPLPGHGHRARPSLPSTSLAPSDPAAHPLLPPPPLPRPWTWRCHNCNTLVRLACTRRCLRCGHRLCTRPGQRRGRTCRMEFDYQRWRVWAAWRETVGDSPSPPPPPASEGRHERRGRQRWRRGRRGDCWQECDYPSECHHLRATRRGEVDAPSGSVSGPVSVVAGCPDHGGSSSSFVAAIDGSPVPRQAVDPAMLESPLARVVTGRLERVDGWSCEDDGPSCKEVEEVKKGNGEIP